MKQSRMTIAMGLGVLVGCSSSSGGSTATDRDGGSSSSSGGYSASSGAASSSGGSSGSSGGSTMDGSSGSSDGSVSDGSAATRDASAVVTYLERTAWVMTGADIATAPWGLNENVNNGEETQCLNSETIDVVDSSANTLVWNRTWALGTLTGDAAIGATGTCETGTASTGTEGPLSDVVTISQGDWNCFDIDAATEGLPPASWQGRASLSADGAKLSLEGYLNSESPSGHRCADGAVGSPGVTLNGVPFTGDAVQVYRIQ